MELSTLQLCQTVLRDRTLEIGSPDFQTVAPIVLTALEDLAEAIRDATTEPWPGGNVGD